MKTFEICGAYGKSLILIDESFKNITQYISVHKTIIVTDENVFRYYKDDFPDCPVIVIGTGEQVKTLQTVEYIYDKLIQNSADRSSFLLGIGGGIVCDITGFVASTYMRGIKFGFVSTTLLAQVDASVGGKNGVNFYGYKNMIGVFNQPEFVICDINLLKTLPKEELISGFAEIVKHAAIASKSMFEYIEKNYQKALSLDIDVISQLVYDSVFIKASIVNKDEREKGERRKLNFGHTYGHAIEKTMGISHGEAVSIGMVLASLLSVKQNYLSESDSNRLADLLNKLELPVKAKFNIKSVQEALQKDKKRETNIIYFVLLKEIGVCDMKEIAVSTLSKVLESLC